MIDNGITSLFFSWMRSVVASMVLHATKNLNRTMAHVRKLLKTRRQAPFAQKNPRPNRLALHIQNTSGMVVERGNRPPNESKRTPPNLKQSAEGHWFYGVDFEVGDCEDSALQT